MRKVQVYKEKLNKIQEGIDAQALFLKFYTKEKQDNFGYTQEGRGHGQGGEKKKR